MIKIKELAPKPSDAVQAMVDGLLYQSKRDNFSINMFSFGDQLGYTECFGCAATCTIQQIVGKDFVPDESRTIARDYSRAEFLQIDEIELNVFESAIDRLRKGSAVGLFLFYDIDYKEYVESFTIDYELLLRPGFYLLTFNWHTQLDTVRGYIKFLREKGL